MPFNSHAYNDIRQHIDKSLLAKNPSLPSPRILAATKQQSQAAIIEAIHAGIMHFGENRVQEAQSKWPAIKEAHPDVTLQMIGNLQSNKVEAAIQLFDEIITVDRESVAKALRKAMDHQGKEIPLMIQVNIGQEEQKSGVLPAEADALIEYCRNDLQLPIVGLMCVPPQGHYPAPYFALLKILAKRHGLARLSMGMSGDFETAIRMGATEIRLGTILFGQRESQ